MFYIFNDEKIIFFNIIFFFLGTFEHQTLPILLTISQIHCNPLLSVINPPPSTNYFWLQAKGCREICSWFLLCLLPHRLNVSDASTTFN